MVLLAMARDRFSGGRNYLPKAKRVRVQSFLILIVFLVEVVLTNQSDVQSNSSRDDSCADMAVPCETSVDTSYQSSQGLYCAVFGKCET